MPDQRSTSRSVSGPAGFEPVFGAGTDNAIPGELLLTLAPSAAESMTASVPVHPAGPVASVRALGVDSLDEVLADLGAFDVTRLAVPAPAGAVGDLALGLENAPDQTLSRSFRVRVPADTDVAAAVARLGALDTVEVAEPNRYRETYAVPNDPRFSAQWGLSKINAPDAWDITTGSSSVVVGVIDTGVDLTHPELASLLVPGYDMVDLGTNPTPPPGYRFEGDFSGRDSTPDDEVGHGTHVSGTIAALSDNGVGVAGVTWQCRIMPVKALTRLVRISDGRVSGVGSSADIAAAVRWAADHGASVISMSLGSSSSTTVESSAIAYAIGKGCVVVAAMGNDGTSNPSFPAAYPDVVSVGAIDSSEHRASFSQTGPHIDVVAPGVDIWSTVPPASYASYSGTSMATPHVSGVAALIRSLKPSATVAEVTDILRSTAKPLRDAPGDPVPNDQYGAGLVDAAAAVAKARPIVIRPTLLPICPPLRTPLLACPPRTLPWACPPRTLACPVRTPLCTTPVTTTPVTTGPTTPPPPTTFRTPTLQTPTLQTPTLQTPTLQTPAWPGPAGAGAAYDPYGYLGAQGAAPNPADTGGGQAEDSYAAGYQAGYAAAMAEVESPWGAADQGQNLAAAAATTNLQPLPYPRSLFYWCPPRTYLIRDCIPVPITLTRTPTTWPTTTWPTTTFPTTTLPPTTDPTPPFDGGFAGGAGFDPYGQSPFQG